MRIQCLERPQTMSMKLDKTSDGLSLLDVSKSVVAYVKLRDHSA